MTWYLTTDGLTVTQVAPSDLTTVITLTDDQAQQSINAKIDGKLVIVVNSAMVIRDPYTPSEQKYVDFKAGTYTLSDLEYADDATQTVVTDTYQNLYKDGHITKAVYDKYLKIDVDAQVAGLINEVNTFASNPLNWSDLTADQQTQLATYRNALKALSSDSNYPEVTIPTKPDFMQ